MNYAAGNIVDDGSRRRFGIGWEVVASDFTNEKNARESELGRTDKGEDGDPNRHITEWPISQTGEDYRPYGEDELRRSGEIRKVGEPLQKSKHGPTSEEIHERLKELRALHDTLSKVTDKFYGLAWTRCRSPDYWNHLWLTYHIAGATVEEVWEITQNKWPKLVKEARPFGPNEAEKLQKFVRTSNITLLECDTILADFDFKREKACCLKLYNALRTFPIAPRWKHITSWEAQDRAIRRRGFSVASWVLNWF
ncbi:hypothetical protein GGR51DRAFT_575698 [Nemania sp. FL0031]|nr:hypothetical protein GGR51DRAFT_575698 [Nemania sp. FL0031]